MIGRLNSIWINSRDHCYAEKLWRPICSFNGGTVSNGPKFAVVLPKIFGKSVTGCRWKLLQPKTQMLISRWCTVKTNISSGFQNESVSTKATEQWMVTMLTSALSTIFWTCSDLGFTRQFSLESYPSRWIWFQRKLTRKAQVRAGSKNRAQCWCQHGHHSLLCCLRGHGFILESARYIGLYSAPSRY